MRSWGARGGGTGAACTASRPLSHPARAGLEEGKKRGPAGPTAKGCWGCKKPLKSAWTHANKKKKKKSIRIYRHLVQEIPRPRDGRKAGNYQQLSCVFICFYT